MIKAHKEEVRELLNTGNVRFKVPRYQRSFVWGKDEALEMLEDLTASGNGPKDNIFLGNIVLHNEREHKFLNLVDGQQRITTLFVVLAASRVRAKQLSNEPLAATIQGKMSFIDDTTGNEQGPRLIVSDLISEVFNATVLDSSWTGDFSIPALRNKKRQVNKIKPIFDVFFHHIKELNPKELTTFLEKVYSCEFIRVEIDMESEAFDIFERSNARGVELNAAELLKNYFFSKIDAGDEIEPLQERWDRIIDYSGSGILRVLKYFYVTNKGHIQRKELFRKLKDFGSDLGPTKLLNSLEQFALAYSTISSPTNETLKELLIDNYSCEGFRIQYHIEEFRRSLEALRLFRITQVYPILISYLYCYQREKKRDNQRTKAFLKTIKNFENFHFINNAIGDQPGNKVEKDYAKLAAEITCAKSFTESTKAINKYLHDKLISAETFKPKFRELSYQNENLGLLYYIFDRINNYNRSGGQIIEIFNPDQRLMRRNYNIEHLLSQSLMNNGEINPDICHNIGNLLSTPLHTNSEMQNKPFVEKVEILKGDGYNLPIIKFFLEKYGKNDNWEEDEINKRAEDLSEEAYCKIWKLS